MRRRGALLLELLISLAIFSATAMLVLVALRDLQRSMERAATRQAALDEARSVLARLEAGAMNINDLRGEVGEDEDSSRFRIRAKTAPTEYRNLTLVELEVRTGEGAMERVECRLRQLVELRPEREQP